MHSPAEPGMPTFPELVADRSRERKSGGNRNHNNRNHNSYSNNSLHFQQQQQQFGGLSPEAHSRLAQLAHLQGIPPPPPAVLATTAMWASLQQSPPPFGGPFGQHTPPPHLHPHLNAGGSTGPAALFSTMLQQHFLQQQQQQQQQHASLMAAATSSGGGKKASRSSATTTSATALHLPPSTMLEASSDASKARSDLELQLMAMPQSRVVEIIADLCRIHPDVRSFAEAKVNLFQLQSAIPPRAAGAPHHTSNLNQNNNSTGSNSNSNEDGHEQQQQQESVEVQQGHVTPRRVLRFGGEEEQHGTAAAEAVGRASEHDDNDDDHEQHSGGTPSTAVKRQQLPGDEACEEGGAAAEADLVHDTDGRRYAPDERPFSKRVHPCVCTWGVCRYPASCILKQAPGNLCLQWLRGQCALGAECDKVHRVPEHNEAVRALFDASHKMF